tara:strand:- start:208 stop:534 length:327 start_codon:yes stop_codon:yes gene_type:complete
MVTYISSACSDGVGVDSPRPVGAQEKIKYKCCLITWKDIIASNEWEKHEDIKCPELVSIGWLVYQDEETVKIANTLDFDDWEAKGADKPVPYGITAFPKGCVVKIDYL